jgi:hypothetical protein
MGSFTRVLVKWFAIGVVVRMALALTVTLLMAVDWEAGMIYLADLPTMLSLDLLESISPSMTHLLSGGHPFYVLMNILGSCIWGLLFMLAACFFSWIKGRRQVHSRATSLQSANLS